MNYHDITKDDMLNGDGIRVVLWVSGCTLQCKGCQNPQAWDRNSGIKFDKSAMSEILTALKPDYIKGLTITGGHPLEKYNVDDVVDIMYIVKKAYPEKDIWIYTGYEFNDIKNQRVLDLADVIVDGRYEEDKRDLSIAFRGSTNQRIWRKSTNEFNDTIWRCDRE